MESEWAHGRVWGYGGNIAKASACRRGRGGDGTVVEFVLLANTWDLLVSRGNVESTDLVSQHAAPAALS